LAWAVIARLIRSYPWFFAFAAGSFLQNGVWFLGDPSTTAYLHGWYWTNIVLVALQAAAVLELGSRLLASYPGIEAILGRLAGFAAALGLFVATLTTVDLWYPLPGRYAILYAVLRYTNALGATVCGLMTLWAWFFNEQPPPNLERHGLILTGYFASQASGLLLVKYLSPEWAGSIVVGSAAAFWALWAFRMLPDGEIAPVPAGDGADFNAMAQLSAFIKELVRR
jgi:hypothetical protein